MRPRVPRRGRAGRRRRRSDRRGELHLLRAVRACLPPRRDRHPGRAPIRPQAPRPGRPRPHPRGRVRRPLLPGDARAADQRLLRGGLPLSRPQPGGRRACRPRVPQPRARRRAEDAHPLHLRRGRGVLPTRAPGAPAVPRPDRLAAGRHGPLPPSPHPRPDDDRLLRRQPLGRHPRGARGDRRDPHLRRAGRAPARAGRRPPPRAAPPHAPRSRAPAPPLRPRRDALSAARRRADVLPPIPEGPGPRARGRTRRGGERDKPWPDQGRRRGPRVRRPAAVRRDRPPRAGADREALLAPHDRPTRRALPLRGARHRRVDLRRPLGRAPPLSRPRGPHRGRDRLLHRPGDRAGSFGGVLELWGLRLFRLPGIRRRGVARAGLPPDVPPPLAAQIRGRAEGRRVRRPHGPVLVSHAERTTSGGGRPLPPDGDPFLPRVPGC